MMREMVERSPIGGGGVIFLGSLMFAACGEPGGGAAKGEETVDETGMRDATVPQEMPDSATSVSRLANDWCATPAVPTDEFVDLDKETFIQTFADYAQGWMTPLHTALLGIDEDRVLPALFETVRATYETQCRHEEFWESLPPGDDLIDPQNQADVRQELVEFLRQGVEVESGPRLRLSLHECANCGEPIGAEPALLNARLTTDGVLHMELELSENESWTRSIYMTPDVVAVQAPLAPLAEWGDTASQSLRDGTAELPDVAGTATVVGQKDAAGTMSWSVGLSELRVAVDPGEPDESIGSSSSPCIGFQVSLGPAEQGSAVAAHLGLLDVSVPGSFHCPSETSCGPKERTGPFGYHLGDFSAVLKQPPAGSGDDVHLDLSAGGPSRATVGDDEFGRIGVGGGGLGGEVKTAVRSESDAFVVTFSPALDMGAALTISSFSEEMRMTLPDWLADEVFDLTFGGDPVGTIRVPMRELCPEGVYPYPEVESRRVRVETGSGTLAVGGDRILEASAGQCVGKSLEDPATFTRTSDWWEAGFVCQ